VKTDNIARELEQSVVLGVESAKGWAVPKVEAAVGWVVPRLQHNVDTASPKIQKSVKAAAETLAGSVATVTPRIQAGISNLGPRITEAVEGATPRIQGTLDRATPVINQARDRVVIEFIPRLSDQIGVASQAVHRTLENTPLHVDAVAQRLSDAGIIRAIQQQADSTGRPVKVKITPLLNESVAETQQPKKRGMLIAGIFAAAVAAGVAAWKASRPVEDPWKTPEPVTPAPVAATTVNEGTETTPAATDTLVVDVESADVSDSLTVKGGDGSTDRAKHAADTDKNEI
jgi:hypothetical protein